MNENKFSMQSRLTNLACATNQRIELEKQKTRQPRDNHDSAQIGFETVLEVEDHKSENDQLSNGR
jgi:hypothetical protein